jgi:hypothetical protein
MLRRALILAAALAGWSCGGGGDDDSDGSVGVDAAAVADAARAPDAPAQPANLTLQGSMTVDNKNNGEIDANHRVMIAIRVSRDGAPVTDAIIRINPAPPAFETFLTGEPLDPSLYTGNYMGYHNTARIEVEAGSDHIPETVLIGIELFKVTSPPAGSVVIAGADLMTTWNRPGVAATSVQVTTDGGYDSGMLPDASSHVVPGTALSADVADDAIHVLRARKNDLPTTGASHVDFGVSSTLPIQVAP